MNYDQFVERVQAMIGAKSTEEALRATRATLEVLGERLTPGEADDLAAQLPEGIKESVTFAPAGQGFDFDEFFRRIAEREGVDYSTAIDHARAVTVVLMEAVSPGEIDDVKRQLPEQYMPLFRQVA